MRPPRGMAAFSVVWAGQLVSLLGSAMTQFGLTLYVFKQTEHATSLALMGFFTFLPLVLFSPTAGGLVYRGNRNLVMMLSDIAGGAVGLGIFCCIPPDIYTSGSSTWAASSSALFRLSSGLPTAPPSAP